MEWDCKDCSETWNAPVRDRVNGEIECPYCSGRKAIPGKTSFKALYPDLMKEWKTISNALLINPDKITDNYTKNVWWICTKCNNSYRMSVKRRILFKKRNHQPCLYCKGYRRNKNHFI